jgi:hypothetical protein
MDQDLIEDFRQTTHFHEAGCRMRLRRWIMSTVWEADTMWSPDFNLGRVIQDHARRADAGVLHCRRPAEV